MDGDRWTSHNSAGCLQCAILAQNPLLAAIVNQQSIPQPSLRFKLCRRRRAQLTGNCERIAGSQGDCGFEDGGRHIHSRQHFMLKLEGSASYGCSRSQEVNARRTSGRGSEAQDCSHRPSPGGLSRPGLSFVNQMFNAPASAPTWRRSSGHSFS